MSRLIESIRLENGRFAKLHYHQARMDDSINSLSGKRNNINLTDYLNTLSFPKVGLFKCRIIYDDQVRSVEFIKYKPQHPKSLKVVHEATIEYPFKFENRNQLNFLFSQRQFCDDILIIKNSFVTDTSYANVIFFDGQRWLTPSTPLLKGTMRQLFIDTAEVKEEIITIQNIASFKKFRLINAMCGFDGPEIEVSRIVF
jgi:4-amino-4-deoxychorismate lyase